MDPARLKPREPVVDDSDDESSDDDQGASSTAPPRRKIIKPKKASVKKQDDDEPQAAEGDDETVTDAANELAKTAVSKALHLYQFSTATSASSYELELQKYVNDRFFRIGREIKAGSTSETIYNKLIALDKKAGGDTQKVSFYLQVNRPLRLDKYHARSVIIALAHFLNEKAYLPTAVYIIGETHILCTKQDKPIGNVYLQVISADGDIIQVPSIYGDGNGDPNKSILVKLNAIIAANSKTNIISLMRDRSHTIVPFKNDYLNFLNFLRAIIEVARYLYRGESPSLNALPIGTAQQRSSELLTDGHVTLTQVYGMDSEFYKKYTDVKPNQWGKDAKGKVRPVNASDAASVFRASYGAVTGLNLAINVDEVKKKIRRINETYNESYHPSKSYHLIEGARLHRVNLAEEYGSGSESDDGDYSDDDMAASKTAVAKLPPLPTDAKKVAAPT